MMKFNKINFGLLMLLFLCRFENILGASDKNIEEGLKGKYKIVDLDGNILKNEKNEDFSFIVTCEYDGDYYKWFKGIEFDIEKIEEKTEINNKIDMKEELEIKCGVSSVGDIVKTQEGKVLVVKDEIKDKVVYLVLGKYDEGNSKTAIFLDLKYKLQTSGPYYIIEENNTASVEISTSPDCGGVKNNEKGVYKFPIVCCELKEVKLGFPLEELEDSSKKSIKKKDDFVEDSGCCDCLCNWCKNLCP